MVSEKQAAFAQAYWEMALQIFRLNWQVSTTLLRAWFSPFSLTAPSIASVMAQTQHAVGTVLEKGLGPMHHATVSNARRLAKTSIR